MCKLWVTTFRVRKGSLDNVAFQVDLLGYVVFLEKIGRHFRLRAHQEELTGAGGSGECRATEGGERD